MSIRTHRSLIRLGSFILGFGFLGTLDGVIFHQILQWHSVYMATDRTSQIVSDGLFHLAVTVALVLGGILLWAAGNPSIHTKGVRLLIGWFLIGGGTFNIVEGVINHHILQIHRVKPTDSNPLLYDLSFLILGGLLIILGFIIKRQKNIQPTDLNTY